MAWMDYKKAYDMVPHLLLGMLKYLEMFGAAKSVVSWIGERKSWEARSEKTCNISAKNGFLYQKQCCERACICSGR